MSQRPERLTGAEAAMRVSVAFMSFSFFAERVEVMTSSCNRPHLGYVV